MKLVTKEEIEAQQNATLAGGAKGFLAGSLMSLGIYAAAPRYYPRLLKLPYSIKTAVAVIPIAVVTTVVAELASNNFDNQMYASDYTQKKTLEEHRRWSQLSTADKTIEVLNGNKYKIIVGLWAGSMWGSWAYVNRDKLLTKTQKFVIARMYAQFLTVGLLLGSIGLSMWEENRAKKNHTEKVVISDDDAFLKEVIAEGEAEEKLHHKA